MRAALFAASFLAFVTLTHGRALAVVEYCGAQVDVSPAITEQGSPTIYAFVLSANSSRTVAGHLSIRSTDGSWYGASLPSSELTAYSQSYRNITFDFTRATYESQPIYIRFPASVRPSSVDFDVITVRDEHTMGWDSNKRSCPWTELDPDHPFERVRAEDLDFLNPKPVQMMPPSATVIDAVSIAAPGKTDCAIPLKRATVTNAIAPNFPLEYRNVIDSYHTIVDVAINASGGIDDTWVVAPSGIIGLDEAALQAGRASTYAPARSFCQNAPGIVRFAAEFNPD